MKPKKKPSSWLSRAKPAQKNAAANKESLPVPEGSAQPTLPSPKPSDERHERFIAEVSTGMWRLRRKMIDPGTNRPHDEMRIAYRHFEAVWVTLLQYGIEMLDHTGERFIPGLALKVLTMQPDPMLVREQIIETVKPSIYFRGLHIQLGEVIVGFPEISQEVDKPALDNPSAENEPSLPEQATDDTEHAPASPAATNAPEDQPDNKE